jgi:hypothetical protein
VLLCVVGLLGRLPFCPGFCFLDLAISLQLSAFSYQPSAFSFLGFSLSISFVFAKRLSTLEQHYQILLAKADG